LRKSLDDAVLVHGKTDAQSKGGAFLLNRGCLRHQTSQKLNFCRSVSFFCFFVSLLFRIHEKPPVDESQTIRLSGFQINEKTALAAWHHPGLLVKLATPGDARSLWKAAGVKRSLRWAA